MWDTGTSVGTLSGPAKPCNNIDIKQNRPYRLIISSEDYSSYFYEGPPFKFKIQANVSRLFSLLYGLLPLTDLEDPSSWLIFLLIIFYFRWVEGDL